MKNKRLLFHFTFLIYFLCPISTWANQSIVGPVNQESLSKIKKLLDTPEEEIDFAHIKLTIDNIIDPTVNISRENIRLERIVKDIKKLGLETSMERKEALRRYLYEAGEWNNFKPFTYDFDDPNGTDIDNKLFKNYLTTKKGNCISMPFLFIALGQKLDLDVTASTAPNHVFVKYTDTDSGRTYNLETTSGAQTARDEWIREQLPMTDLAIKNKLYMQKLSRKKTAAIMLETLLDHYRKQNRHGQLIATANVLIEHYPESINTVIKVASAYNHLLKVHNVWQYHLPHEVPLQKRRVFTYLTTRINELHHYAESLGWRNPKHSIYKS
ncbi:transglutaminase-like domain-containing protein [Marinibactrum halimedae]|uniref:Protein SirB1 N-terminal domain-containing protein n=1 Tax=Marinibactrum halimedae TaxID=1444977 RepID=A0AA37T9Z6_9GAMM|nr:transglutaminase-like domain-containing protein [Marinibactrum halimedae]MCD9461254.1 transglutaminase-like domain-containing protein [Marinibactrum halimedae]GLS27583.1 hypothetical protein GCM10007877_33020 [Marinibactrum halimedae]